MITLNLGPDDDRVVGLDVTDHNGNRYYVLLEFLSQHEFGDAVQVCIHKPWKTPESACQGPNAVYLSTAKFKDRVDEHGYLRCGPGWPANVWFVFDRYRNMPRVPNDSSWMTDEAAELERLRKAMAVLTADGKADTPEYNDLNAQWVALWDKTHSDA